MSVDSSPSTPTLFNSNVETAVRILVLLEALYPRRCNMQELTWFDHIVVHTGGFHDAPPSLHPKTIGETGELLVRRHLLAEGLQMLKLLHLVEENGGDDGIGYMAGDEAPLFLEMLRAPYHLGLKERAGWVAEKFGPLKPMEIEREITETIGRWAAEIQSKAHPVGAIP
jgi:hypothetical protein